MRLIRFAALAAGLVLAGQAHAQAPASDPSDMARGSAKAPITVIEYASVGCPHCAKLHNDVFPAIKKKYIDTGKVRWVAREVITGDPRIATAGFLLARCAGPAKYFQITDAVYHDQDKLFENPKPGLLAIAQAAGLNEDQFNACLNDKKNYDALDARGELAVKDGVRGTPTLMIKGKVVGDGEMTLAEFDKVIAEAQKPPVKKPAAKNPAAKPQAKPAPKTPARK